MKAVQLRRLTEGGAAVISILPRLQQHSNEKLEYTKISQKDIVTVFDTSVKEILDALKSNGVIAQNYQPKYTLGSSRLAADIAGRPVVRYPGEDEPTVAQARTVKQQFGDLDIDLELQSGKTMLDASKVIESIDPARFAVRNAGEEINVGCKIGTKVIQIDLINVGTNRNRWEFQQTSSHIDTANKVKGMIQSILLASVIQTIEFDTDEKIRLSNLVQNHPDIQKWINNGYTLTNMGRYLLGATGVRVVVEMKKEGVKTKKIIDIEPNSKMGYENLDKLAKFILQNDSANVGDIFSAIKMAQFIKNNNPEKIRSVWEKFVNKMHVEGDDPQVYIDGLNGVGKALGISNKEISKAVKELK